jgi:hypothetical protein
MDIESLQDSRLTIPREYFLARRRYASAMRRGDLKMALAWLDIAEREMALVERYERAEQRGDLHRERPPSKFRPK